MNARQHQSGSETVSPSDYLAGRFPSSAPSGRPDTGPPERVRRTYYFSRAVADELEAAGAAVHEVSHGAVPEHQAYDEIIRAGLERAEEIVARHQS